MDDFLRLWDEARPDVPAWASRVLRPKHRLWTLQADGVVGTESAAQALYRIADAFRRSLAKLGEVPDVPEAGLRGCRLSLVENDLAVFYHSEFHYLASPRTDAIHLGVGIGSNPACVLSFSPFDLEHLSPLLPSGVRADQVVVLSRQVTVGRVPRNTWSFAFGRACRWLREYRPNTKFVVTYLDVNLGFGGASYLATNWKVLGSEAKGRYVFVDGVPVTNRELIHRFGSARFDELVALIGSRITRTTLPLRPLSVLGYALRHRDLRRKAATFYGFSAGDRFA